MSTWLIYKHTSIDSGKSYIGLTKHSMLKRWQQHISKALREKPVNNHFHNAIRLYGTERWEHVELKTGIDTLEAANEAEKEYILEYGTFEDGYNSVIGGGSNKGVKGSQHHFFGKKKSKAAAKKSADKRKGIYAMKTPAELAQWNSNVRQATRDAYDSKVATLISPDRQLVVTGYVNDIATMFRVHKTGLNELASGERPYWSGWYVFNEEGIYTLKTPLFEFSNKDLGIVENSTIVALLDRYPLNKANIYSVVQGKRGSHKGWTVDITKTVYTFNIQDTQTRFPKVKTANGILTVSEDDNNKNIGVVE